jgi:hypothetical protein
MRQALFWIGGIVCVLGVAVVVASAVMGYMGYATSYNFGDPGKFQFFLVPLWHIGLAVAAVGAVCLLVSRWLMARPR